MCIVGKNGAGKTTLIRAIKNFKSADTFSTTASPYIFSSDSQIIYSVNDVTYDFRYNSELQMIDSKKLIDKDIKDKIYVELPIPHGERFNHFQKLGDIDSALRRSISFEEYVKPEKLIAFLSKVYGSNRFDNLKEITVKGAKYYFILKSDDYYIREDYLSSGEYFIINLFKMIRLKCKLIVIDEIDISLDASAQVNLISELRGFCASDKVNIVFTTHSLALMKTLSDVELNYMENNEGVVTLQNRSYNYVKSILFGFRGWDKYILTEDEVLDDYLTYLIAHDNAPIFFKYKVIYVAGGTNVVSLMNRNVETQFFSSADNVISVLDGDQNKDEARLQYCKNNEMIFFIPFQSIEKQLLLHYRNEGRDGLPEVIYNSVGSESKVGKRLYKSLVSEMSKTKVFSFINDRNKGKVKKFREQLMVFLNAKNS